MEKIKYAQVEEYCNELHATANRMKSILDEIKGDCSLISSSETWCGDASDFYVSKMKKLISNFDDAYIELENAIIFMAKCSDGYSAIDKNVSQQICDNLHITQLHLGVSKIFSEFY
jgi:uncharacterized protein YukE